MDGQPDSQTAGPHGLTDHYAAGIHITPAHPDTPVWLDDDAIVAIGEGGITVSRLNRPAFFHTSWDGFYFHGEAGVDVPTAIIRAVVRRYRPRSSADATISP